MRPIQRGVSPITVDYDDYRHAFPELVSRLGHYCSYCERRFPAVLAVEHIQPKGLPRYAHLTGRWDNFLLGCVNCNSTKTAKDVKLHEYFLPDRDNTFSAFDYTADGLIEPSTRLTPTQETVAKNTLKLVGLDKAASDAIDSNGVFVAIERVRQRKEAWEIAEIALEDYLDEPTDGLKRSIVNNALSTGYFSVWMTVFEQYKEMRQLFIDKFNGTAHNCFDANTQSISPRPQNGLAHAGKI